MDSIKNIKDTIKHNGKTAKVKLDDTKVKLQKLKEDTTVCLEEIKGQTGALGSEVKQIKAGFNQPGGRAGMKGTPDSGAHKPGKNRSASGT